MFDGVFWKSGDPQDVLLWSVGGGSVASLRTRLAWLGRKFEEIALAAPTSGKRVSTTETGSRMADLSRIGGGRCGHDGIFRCCLDALKR